MTTNCHTEPEARAANRADALARQNARLVALLLQGVEAISLGEAAQRRWLDAVAEEMGVGA